MPAISLYDYQEDAVKRMKNGCILCGGVGSGKSRTALAYYYILNGGKLSDKKFYPMHKPCDLYIITTARKRDTLEWDKEMSVFLLTQDASEKTYYRNKVVVDSWNNIKKYRDVKDAFFIFDEQRVVGYGAWTKSFLRIAKNNRWVLLSATPGDTWTDYIPVFIANGFYRNKYDFEKQHVVYARNSKFPRVDYFIRTGTLLKHRNDILVTMDFHRETVAHHEYIYTEYDRDMYRGIIKTRWNPFLNKPIENAPEFCYCLRKVTNSAVERQVALLQLLEDHPKAIIFYNFNYERDILKALEYGRGVKIAEWNGHEHEQIPKSKKWVYLVQYSAGAEGWNCIETDTIIFFSQNYSYKIVQQAAGRIDRLNTPFTDLYYYHLKSKSGIDSAISQALKNKKAFNESAFATSTAKKQMAKHN